MRRLLLLIALATLTAGCSSTTAGQPAPAGPTSAGISLPERPRELPLDGVDPCSLLTPAQRAELGLDGAAMPGTDTTPLFAGPTCTMTGFEPRAISVDIAFSTENGIEAVSRPGATKDTVTPTTVAEFPALLAEPTFLGDFCSVDVDVAEGQFLDIQLADGGRTPPVPQDELCRDVVKVAELAVLTLSSS